MLPEFLTGSYKRYKEDTSVFATWLSSTAQACGHKAAKFLPSDATPASIVQQTNAPSTRLKGKARKEAREAKEALSLKEQVATQPVLRSSSHLVNTNELLIQAAVIAGCKTMQMPATVYRVVKRAIIARRRCLDWFQQTRPEDESNASHKHFIGILENALELLDPCISKLNGAHVPANQSRPDEPVLDDTLHNRFSVLSIEDIDDEALDVTSTDIVVVKSKVVDVYEVQTDPYMDIAFRLYCFFEDLHRIQEFLKDTWRRYAAGDLELMAASLTTNIALELVRRAEDEVVSNFPAYFQKDCSYSKLASVLLDSQSGPTQHGDFIYNSTYSTIEKFMHYKTEDCDPTPSAGLHYFFNPELEPASGEWKADDKLLTQYLHEFMFRAKLKRLGAFRNGDRVDDVLSVGLQSLMEGKISDIRLWLVFGANTMLDIWKILGSKSSMGYTELLERGGKAKAIFGLKSTEESLFEEWQDCTTTNQVYNAWRSIKIIETNPSITYRDYMNQHGHHRLPIVLDTKTAARNVVTRYQLGMPGAGSLHGSTTSSRPRPYADQLKLITGLSSEGWARTFDAVIKVGLESGHDIESEVNEVEALIVERKIDTEMIQIDYDDPAFYDKHNLIYCGMEAIQLTMNTEAAGIDLINTTGSLLAICHIVNAARQLKLLEAPWKDLDDMTSLHINRLFSGALPSSAREMYSRLCLVTGTPASAFARNARGSHKFSTKNLALISETATGKVLHRYFEKENKNETIEATLIEAQTQYLQDHKKHKITEKGVTKYSKRHLTLLDVLNQVRDCSQADVERMNIDYVTLNRTCSELGDRIAAKIDSKLNVDHRGMQKQVRLRTFDHVIMAKFILKEVNEWNVMQENKKRLREPPSEYPPQLQVAAKVIRKFVRELEAKAPPQYEPFLVPTLQNTPDVRLRNMFVSSRLEPGEPALFDDL